MTKQLRCFLGLLITLALTDGCAPAPDEKMVIERRVNLPSEHYPKPYGISRMSNGDFVVFGVTGRGVATDYRPWATRVSVSGEKRWEFLQGGIAALQGFHSAFELDDHTIVLCGLINPERRSIVVLDHLRADGSLLEERLIRPNSPTGHLSLFNCSPWGHGIALAAGIFFGSGDPTGWLARVDEHLQVQWEQFNSNYNGGDLIQSGDDGLYMLSWAGADSFILNLGPTGAILARHGLPEGESHLVQRSNANRSGVAVVSMSPEDTTDLLEFDGQLRQTRRLTLHNVGVQKAVEPSDGTITIFGSQFHNGATAAVTRIYKNGSHRVFLPQPPHQSPWYSAAVASGANNEFAATRELFDGRTMQLLLDWISFK
jgi:hypothetical protein